MIGVEKIVVRIDWLSEKQRYDYISARQPVLKIMTPLKGVIFIASLTVMKSHCKVFIPFHLCSRYGVWRLYTATKDTSSKFNMEGRSIADLDR